MTRNRGLLFWGLALITGGAVALAAQQGYLDSDALAGAWRLWPLILIAIGLSIVLSRTPFAVPSTIVAALVVGAAGGVFIAAGPGCGGGEPTTLDTSRGAFGDAAKVTLDFNCGTLEVEITDDAEWSVTTTNDADDSARLAVDRDSLHLEAGVENDSWWGGSQQNWMVTLPSETRYELDVSPNAADTRLDLRGGDFASVSLSPNAGSVAVDLTAANVDDFRLSLNAGSASIIVADGTDVSGALSVNAGSIELCMSGSVVWSLTVDENLTFSHNLDESGFGRDGDTWSYTPSYPSGAVVSSVNLRIDGNAASFTLNPDDECDTAASD